MDSEERLRILKMIESGQVNAEDGARLLEAFDREPVVEPRPRTRMLRIRITDLARQRGKIEVRIPLSLINVGLRLGAKLAPRVTNEQLQHLTHEVERGATGRVFEVHDLEEGERIEVFVE
jgi:hypothetical protein